MGLESQNSAAEIKIRAERRAGELLTEIERKDSKENLKRGPTSQPGTPGDGYMNAIKAAGIPKTTAYNWQTMAKLPEPMFETAVQVAKEKELELTSAGGPRGE